MCNRWQTSAEACMPVVSRPDPQLCTEGLGTEPYSVPAAKRNDYEGKNVVEYEKR